MCPNSTLNEVDEVAEANPYIHLESGFGFELDAKRVKAWIKRTSGYVCCNEDDGDESESGVDDDDDIDYDSDYPNGEPDSDADEEEAEQQRQEIVERRQLRVENRRIKRQLRAKKQKAREVAEAKSVGCLCCVEISGLLRPAPGMKLIVGNHGSCHDQNDWDCCVVVEDSLQTGTSIEQMQKFCAWTGLEDWRTKCLKFIKSNDLVTDFDEDSSFGIVHTLHAY